MQEDFLYQMVSRERHRQVAEVLSEVKVPYAIIKGEALSYHAYGKFGKRRSSDVDILVSRKNRDVIRDAFLRHGFSMKGKTRAEIVQANLYTHQMIPLTKPSKYEEMAVDVNFDIFWGEYQGVRVDVDRFLEHTVPMKIYGYEFQVLPHEKAMVQLILHHYKEMNSIFHLMTHDSFNVKMLDDVYYYVKSWKNVFTPEAIWRVMQVYGIAKYAYYVFYYVAKVHPDGEILKIRDALYSEEAEKLLNRYGLEEEEYGEWEVGFEERLKSEDLSQFLKHKLSKKSMEKLNQNVAIFLS